MTHDRGAHAIRIRDAEWEVIEPIVDELLASHSSRRRRHPARDIVSAILWVTETKAPWRSVPQSLPPYQTCHRYYIVLERGGGLDRILKALESFRRESSIDSTGEGIRSQ